ncbi:MAG: carbon monoxide dehydrogenase subunit G [Alphaproteobacteria bacterium]|nr:carbon monoxide dehydrogenase subunit G [Alphaproteobacteria bacterium]
MEITGEYRIGVLRQRVWEGLNDPEVLKQCIPGCEEISKTSDTEMSARVRAKVGPVSTKFSGTVILSNLKPPESYTISGEGKGGAAGFAKGSADVALEEDDGDTILRYTATAQVGGKLAQIGSRLIQGTADKMANEFFAKFSEVVTAGAAPAAATDVEAEQAPPQLADAPRRGLSPAVWIGGVVGIVILVLLIFG